MSSGAQSTGPDGPKIVVLKLWPAAGSPRRLVKTQAAAPAYSVDLGRGLLFCISNKILGAAAAAVGVGAMLENQCPRAACPSLTVGDIWGWMNQCYVIGYSAASLACAHGPPVAVVTTKMSPDVA